MAATVWTPVPAQESEPRVIHNGNVDIVVEGASNMDLNVAQYKAFDHFAAEHPEIIRQLRKKPKLIDGPKYLGDHPELAQFMNEHPAWRADLDANPGNYLHLSPDVEKATVERTREYSD